MNQGPYELTREIGSGGFATVYRGLREDTGLVAAVKVQKPGPLALARFQREIDVLRQLDHPHVMPLIEADPAGRWYAMPLAALTLRQLHDRNPLNWETLREALSSICGAMLHMHAAELVHRDASPGNVLQLQDGRWVLADYGLVRRPPGAPEALTRTGARIGTPFFSAPEVHHDPRSATPKADAYSLGALASWFTLISRDRVVESAQGLYWSELIRNTVLFNPEDRWSVSDVARHVARPLPVVEAREPVAVLAGVSALEACMRCGARAGIDAAGRCPQCGFLDEL